MLSLVLPYFDLPAEQWKDQRTLICVIRGLPGEVFSVTVNAAHKIYSIKTCLKSMIDHMILQSKSEVFRRKFYRVNPRMLDLYCTDQFPGGWARLDESNRIEDIDDPQSISPLIPTETMGGYFAADIPSQESGVVHVVAEVSMRTLVSVAPKSTTTSLPDDQPTSPDESGDEEAERYRRVREALGLFVHWSLDGTDFSQPHRYHGAQWLEYQRLFGERCSRVYIGDKPTWRDLFIACNEAVELLEGSVTNRYVEVFELQKDGVTLKLFIGTQPKRA